jgi:hypothetical protein
MYYDRQGNKISLEEAGVLLERAEARIVKKTKVGTQEVFTVYLVIDHGLGGGRPIIFETMIFPECGDVWRYGTEEEALVGHEKAVKLLEARVFVLSSCCNARLIKSTGTPGMANFQRLLVPRCEKCGEMQDLENAEG